MLIMKPLLAVTLLTVFVMTSPNVLAEDATAYSTTLSPTDAKREDIYWSGKRKVRSIQKRNFFKDKRHEFTLFTGVVPNDEFFVYFPIGIRWNYYFSEDISGELWATYQGMVRTDLEANLDRNAEGAFIIKVPQSLVFLAGADVLWSPIHGKFAMFADSLAHFDAYLSFGAGFIMTTVREETGAGEQLKPDIAGNVGLGFRVYLNDFLSFRMDYRQYIYAAEVGDIAHPAEFTFGVGLWTDSPE